MPTGGEIAAGNSVTLIGLGAGRSFRGRAQPIVDCPRRMPSPKLRRVALLIALLLLLGLAWTGLYRGFNLLAPSHTRGQKVQAIAQMALIVASGIIPLLPMAQA